MLTTVEFSGELFVGGWFSFAGGLPVDHLARWNGAQWLGFTDTHVQAPSDLHIHAGELYAAGWFDSPGGGVTGVLKWNGANWLDVGPNPPQAPCFALESFRGRLIIGGMFDDVSGGQPRNRIAQFDGAQWQPLGPGTSAAVRALAVWDPDGRGSALDLLIAGGEFTQAGGLPSPGVAAWDGAAWSSLGAGTNGEVRALAVYKNRVAVGGFFSHAGGQPAPYFAFYGCPDPCYPNCDGSSPALNIADFTCFLQKFAAADPYANCDQSSTPPALNIADFTCFLRHFAQGCQ